MNVFHAALGGSRLHGPQVQALSANALIEHLRRLDGLSQGPDFRVITGAVKIEAARAEKAADAA